MKGRLQFAQVLQWGVMDNSAFEMSSGVSSGPSSETSPAEFARIQTLKDAPFKVNGGAIEEAISENFNDPSWSFDFDQNSSSNKLWAQFEGDRFKVVERAGSADGLLRLQSHDNLNPEDADKTRNGISSVRYERILGQEVTNLDLPTVSVQVYVPAFLSMPKDGKFALAFGLGEKDSKGANGFPRIYVNAYDDEIAFFACGFCTGKIQYSQFASIPRFEKDKEFAGGWVTLGQAFDAEGRIHYYFRRGQGQLTEADKKQTPDFQVRMSKLNYHFFTVFEPNGNLSMDWRIDNVMVNLVR
jgi:hypothetical protein